MAAARDELIMGALADQSRYAPTDEELDRYRNLPMPTVPRFRPNMLTPEAYVKDYMFVKPSYSEGQTIPQKGFGRYGKHVLPGTPTEPVYQNNEPLQDDPELERYVQHGGGRHGVFGVERTPPPGESSAWEFEPDVTPVGNVAVGGAAAPPKAPALPMGALADPSKYAPTDEELPPPDPQPPERGWMGTLADLLGPSSAQAASLLPGRAQPGIRAYHSSPHDFERFDLSKVGTGQGAQSYGHGIYFAENPAVSGWGGDYWREFTRALANKADAHGLASKVLLETRGDAAKAIERLQFEKGSQSWPLADEAIQLLSGGKAGARTYEVNINAKPEQFLEHDVNLNRQAPSVKDALWKSGIYQEGPYRSGALAYQDLADRGTVGQSLAQRQAAASEVLNKAGIPGIRYLDQGSRVIPGQVSINRRIMNDQRPTSNYVVFDDKLIDILKKYGLAATAGGAAGTAAALAPGEAQAQPMGALADSSKYAPTDEELDRLRNPPMPRAPVMGDLARSDRLLPPPVNPVVPSPELSADVVRALPGSVARGLWTAANTIATPVDDPELEQLGAQGMEQARAQIEKNLPPAQTRVGKFVNAPVEMAANPFNWIGPGTAAMKGAWNAGSGLSSEAMGQLFEGTPNEQVARTIGAWGPAVGERAVALSGKLPAVAATAAAKLPAWAQQAYEAIPSNALGMPFGKIIIPQPRKMGELVDPTNYGVPPPTGSHNPLDNVPVTFRGKEPGQMTPEETTAWGEHYGLKDLGKISPLQTFMDKQALPFVIPGGTDGKWTHADLVYMKAHPINPNNIDPALHIAMQKKLGRTHTPDELTDEHVWNGLIFGMTSPNNPLFPNQMAASRLRLRTPEMLDDLASMVPWEPGTKVPQAERNLVNDQIANRYGLGGFEETGGLGARGTAQYSHIGELAKMFRQNPEFFRKRPDETWLQAVERMASQVQGLSMKTGSLGTVWQDPATAGVSAIDRHMAKELDKRGGLFASPAERTSWENNGVELWNNRELKRFAQQTTANAKLARRGQKTHEVEPADMATSFDDLMSKKGSDSHLGEMLLSHVGNASKPLLRYATGAINPNVPPHLAAADWVREPEKVRIAGAAYRRALDLNQQLANRAGLPLYMSQWMEWDKIRNRFEPHENMYPGLSKLPAQSVEQLRKVDEAHRLTGHKTYGKSEESVLLPTRPYAGNPFQMGLYGAGGAAVLPQFFPSEERVR